MDASRSVLDDAIVVRMGAKVMGIEKLIRENISSSDGIPFGLQ